MVDSRGFVFVMGSNEYGQLGLGKDADQNVFEPTQVPAFSDCAKETACGEDFTLFLSISGLIFSTGRNDMGQLGLGTQVDQDSCAVIDSIASVAIRKIIAGSFAAAISEDDESLYIWGHSETCLQPSKLGLGPITQISIGHNFACALTREKGLYTWGSNSQG
jgi:alpha-tubulin suppressor-like RCC1 family protein